jgi:starch phosphorylase
MKAALNGVPHLSIGDGWWAEGFNGDNGWVIDGGVTGDTSTRLTRPMQRRSIGC